MACRAILLSALFACHGARPPPAEIAAGLTNRAAVDCPFQSNIVALQNLPVATDVDDVVAVMLQRLNNDRDVLPGWDLLPKRGPTWIIDTVTIGTAAGHLHAHALPPPGTRAFELKSGAELHAEADRRGDPVPYLFVDTITFEGTCAMVSVGVSTVQPTREENGALLGRCFDVEVYQKREQRWTFVRVKSTACG